MPTLLLIWVCLCAYLNCAGWLLSALHQLNAAGYAVALTLGLAGLFFWNQKSGAKIFPGGVTQKFRRRFRRKFPLAFLILAGMALLGGILYAPSNYDALAYRVPRVLHWLAAGQWHWINTVFDRVNDRSCGIEWVSAPVIALFKTDRFLFLINFVSFLFLPGLVFSVFTRLGVRRRVAWHWMWLVPTGYGLLLQAGSIGNDLFGAVFALAAVDFALRARNSGSPRDFLASVLAAALMTSAKTSSLPLLLPWAVALLPSLKIVLRAPLKTFAVIALAAFASALPTIAFNIKYAGDWSGAGVGREHNEVKHALVLRSAANVALVTLENFVPPVFPVAPQWNRAVEKNLPAKLKDDLAALIETPGCRFALGQMQIEEDAGLGCGLSLLLCASVAAVFLTREKKSAPAKFSWTALVRCAPWVSLAAVLAAANLSALARVLVPFYALLLPLPLALAGHERLVKTIWWRRAAFAVFAAAGVLLVVSPARPLFPALTILKHLPHPPARLAAVYETYRARPDAMALVREFLPADLKVLGLASFDDPETSLWRPFGSRRVEHVAPADSAADLKVRGVKYILFRDGVTEEWFHCPLPEWLQQHDAQIVKTIPLNLRASAGPRDWFLVKLN
jgi:hypothetical protein